MEASVSPISVGLKNTWKYRVGSKGGKNQKKIGIIYVPLLNQRLGLLIKSLYKVDVPMASLRVIHSARDTDMTR